MDERFSRTEQLFGSRAMERLAASRVAVFGLGGVGGYAFEALVRSGIGAVDVIDGDSVGITNLNRQILATLVTLGKLKTQAAVERAKEINPECKVTAHPFYFTPQTAENIDFKNYDFVIDAIDMVTGKLEIISCAQSAGVPVISCMGAGNKLNPTAFEVADISETSVCPLARVMRRELKKRGITSLKVVYSKEQPYENENRESSSDGRIPASNSFVPPVAGLIAAGEVIKYLIKGGEK